MKTLKLFNAVLKKEDGNKNIILDNGLVIEAGAVYAQKRIEEYYKKQETDLNKTFHKSWKKIKNSSRYELFIHQLLHYLSTYGSNFTDEIYIPEDVLNVPDCKLKLPVIRALTEQQIIEQCFDLLNSGIALKEETITDIFSILVDEIKYKFTGKEKIKNKEAVIILADMYNIIPQDTMEFIRFIIYKATGKSLLIKNIATIEAIKESQFNPSALFNRFGLVKLSGNFNRFKPLFLAFKNKCPKTINKISKLSKKHHRPLPANMLNMVTVQKLSSQDKHWLDNATPFALFKALNACYNRYNGANEFLYRIRNGKSWVKVKTPNTDVPYHNYRVVLEYLKSKYKLTGTKIYFPENIEYALPTSEKMFVGNIPVGTKFFGDKMAVGIYWQNDWGANDLDISGLNLEGKIGWNSAYSQKGNLMYSGDITDAPNGAVEYLYANAGLSFPTLVLNYVYWGDDDCKYRIIIGQGDNIDRSYMMNPNNLFCCIDTQSVKKETILGIFMPEGNGQSFTLVNTAFGNMGVSFENTNTINAIKALFSQYNNPIKFSQIVKEFGAEIVEDKKEATIDFSLEELDKNKFINLFK